MLFNNLINILYLKYIQFCLSPVRNSPILKFHELLYKSSKLSRLYHYHKDKIFHKNINLIPNQAQQIQYIKSTDYNLTLPGYIQDACNGSYDIYVTCDLRQYLTSQSVSTAILGRSYMIQFNWKVIDDIHSVSPCSFINSSFQTKSKLEYHRNNNINPSSSSSQTFTSAIESVSTIGIRLTSPYTGPNVKNCIPRIHMSTNLQPSFTSTITTYDKRSDLQDIAPELHLSTVVTAIDSHPTLPYVILGLYNDHVTILCNE